MLRGIVFNRIINNVSFIRTIWNDKYLKWATLEAEIYEGYGSIYVVFIKLLILWIIGY